MSLKPGSDEAASLGCECPRAENGHGTGADQGVQIPLVGGGRAMLWWVNDECPLHGDDAPNYWREVNHGFAARSGCARK